MTGMNAQSTVNVHACTTTAACGADVRLSCRKRFVFVNLDACMAAQGVTITVLEQLKVLREQLAHACFSTVNSSPEWARLAQVWHNMETSAGRDERGLQLPQTFEAQCYGFCALNA